MLIKVIHRVVVWILFIRTNPLFSLFNFNRYENELGMRQSVEADIAGLKALLGEVDVAKTDLTMQIEALIDDLATMKRNHEEVSRSVSHAMLKHTGILSPASLSFRTWCPCALR